MIFKWKTAEDSEESVTDKQVRIHPCSISFLDAYLSKKSRSSVKALRTLVADQFEQRYF